jgi:hypothetical protein
MKKTKLPKRFFASADGVTWRVEVRSPASSNVMIVFLHPAAGTSRLDRYAWYQWQGPEAAAVNSVLHPETVMQKLTDEELGMLYRKSMPIYTRL